MEELVLLLIIRLNRKDASPDLISGEMVLKYGWMMRGLSFLATGFSVALALVLLLNDGPGNRDNDRIVGVGLLAFGLSEGFLILETVGVSIRLGDESIVGYAPWRMPRTIDWKDVRHVHYSHAMKWFIITGSNGTKIRVSVLISGVGTLVTEIHSRLAPPAYEKALSGFSTLGL